MMKQEDKELITIGTKIRSKANPDEILIIISDDCHGDKFECSDGNVLSLKQIEKYFDIIGTDMIVCYDCHTVVRYQEDDVIDGCYVICPCCGEHLVILP